MFDGDDDHPGTFLLYYIVSVNRGLARKQWTHRQLALATGLSEAHVGDLLAAKVYGSVATWERLLATVSDDDTIPR